MIIEHGYTGRTARCLYCSQPLDHKADRIGETRKDSTWGHSFYYWHPECWIFKNIKVLRALSPMLKINLKNDPRSKLKRLARKTEKNLAQKRHERWERDQKKFDAELEAYRERLNNPVVEDTSDKVAIERS